MADAARVLQVFLSILCSWFVFLTIWRINVYSFDVIVHSWYVYMFVCCKPKSGRQQLISSFAIFIFFKAIKVYAHLVRLGECTDKWQAYFLACRPRCCFLSSHSTFLNHFCRRCLTHPTTMLIFWSFFGLDYIWYMYYIISTMWFFFFLQGASDAQMVAVKQQARESVQGRKEFLVEVLILAVLSHPNFVSLIGFCAQGTSGCCCTSTCSSATWRVISLVILLKII